MTYRAKAKIIRLLVVITLRMARIKHTRGSLDLYQQKAEPISTELGTNINKQIAPAVFLVASIKICRSGPAAEVVIVSMSPATKSKTIRKMAPVKVPIPTQETIILGPSIDGFGTSVDR